MDYVIGIMVAAFVCSIGGALVWYLRQERNAANSYVKNLADISELITGLVTNNGAITTDAQKRMTTDTFVIEEGEGQQRIKVRGERLIAKSSPIDLLSGIYASDYRFVPAVLTSLGVLGTFLGISVGLLTFSTAGASVEEITSAATNLLGGMKTAFWTSVLGLLSSIIFTLRLKRSTDNADKALENTKEILSRLTYCPSASELLMNLGGDNQDELIKLQIKVAKESAEQQKQLGQTLEKMESSLGSLSSEKLGEVMGQAVAKSTQEYLAPAMNSIAEEISELKAIKKDNGEALVRTIFKTMRDEIVEPMSAQMKSVGENVLLTTDAINGLTGSLTETSEKLAKTSEVMTQFQEDTMGKLQGFAQDLSSILGQFQTSVSETLTQVSSEISSSMSVAKEGMEDQRVAFKQSAEEAAKTFSDQNSQLEHIGIAAKDMMEDASRSLENGLGDIDSKIRSMADTTQQELERFRVEYQGNLENFFDKQANLLEESLGAQREGLSDVVDRFKDVFVEDLQVRLKQYAELSEGEKVLRELKEAVGATEQSTLSQLAEISRSLGGQVQRIEKAYLEGAVKFKELGDEMPKAMKGWFEEAKDTQEKFFRDFDEESAKIFGHLVNVAEVLHQGGSTKVARQKMMAEEA
ncbi:MAG: flagellar basal body-associated protein FliL/cold shock CspA family protein [Oleispira sp.]|jgi:flagellar basal body-associated protein FliL